MSTSLTQRLVGLLSRDRVGVYPWMISYGMVVGWVIIVALGSGWTDVFGNVVGNDFLAFYSAATMVTKDPGAPLYDPLILHDVQRTLIPGMTATNHVPYLNPPEALVWFGPFAALDFGSALLLWWALGLVAWVMGHLLLRGALLRGDWSLRQMLTMSFLFPPTVLWWIYGQATPFLFLALVGSLVLLVRGRDFAAGACLGLLAFKPHVALGLAVPILAGRRWSATAGCGIALGMQIALAEWLWPGQHTEFLEARDYVFSVLVDPSYPTWGIQSVFGFFHLLIGPFAPSVADFLTGLVGVVGVVLLGWGWRHVGWDPSSVRWRIAMAATLLAVLPLGIQLFSYDTALCLIPFWLAIDAVGARPGTGDDPVLDAGPILAGSGVLWILSFAGPYLAMGMRAGTAGLIAPGFALQLFVPATLLIAWAIWRLRPEVD